MLPNAAARRGDVGRRSASRLRCRADAGLRKREKRHVAEKRVPGVATEHVECKGCDVGPSARIRLSQKGPASVRSCGAAVLPSAAACARQYPKMQCAHQQSLRAAGLSSRSHAEAAVSPTARTLDGRPGTCRSLGGTRCAETSTPNASHELLALISRRSRAGKRSPVEV